MTREQYLERLQSLESQISNLKYEYLQANQVAKIGDTVSVTHRGNRNLGWLNDAKVGYNGKIEYSVFKFKKDGTKGNSPLPVYYGAVVEKAIN